jgi:hypothetical protein
VLHLLTTEVTFSPPFHVARGQKKLQNTGGISATVLIIGSLSFRKKDHRLARIDFTGKAMHMESTLGRSHSTPALSLRSVSVPFRAFN